MSTDDIEAREPKPAFRGIRAEEVRVLVAELVPIITGARIDKIFDLGPHAFLLRIRGAAGKRLLYFTTKAGFSRFHLVDDPGAPLPPVPSSQAAELRELLGTGVITGVDQPGGDRVVRFGLRVSRDGRKIERKLVLEMFGSMGRLVVFDEPGRRVRFSSGRGGLEVGGEYRFPDPPARPRSDTATLPFEPKRWLPGGAVDDEVSFHRAFARTMAEAEQRGDLREECETLRRAILQDIKKRRRLLEHLEREEREADRWERFQQLGDLLKAHLGQFERGQTEVEVVDYFDPSLATVRIELDAAKTPTENADHFFQRARKGKRGLERIVARRTACAAALEAAQRALAVLADHPDEGGLAAARAVLLPASPSARRKPSAASRKGPQPPAGPRRFRSREGLDILSGRSARENDHLTLHLARGNDLFFHVARRPGPHVILKVPSGRTAAPESLEDAAFLAGYLSGWRGPGAIDVHWTEVKYVRKRRGSAPGLVEVSREREYRVVFRPELLASLSIHESSDP